MDQDESYHLVLSSSPDDDKVLVANINATTYFGARHALETLSQLIAFDDNTSMMHKMQSLFLKWIASYNRVFLQTPYRLFRALKSLTNQYTLTGA